uniref:Natriuretic peptides B n=1 Tax=Rhinolophus ferrumequinum TaxID=59479 RepID=A0A671FJW8_RHIFE
MDPQMALPRALLLLLLLHLSPLGGLSHPVGGPGPTMELHPHPPQKLLDNLQDEVSEQQEEQMAPKLHQQDSGSVEDWEAKQANSTGSLGSSDFQTQQRQQGSKTMPASSCFGRKMDRINTASRLGCNGEAQLAGPCGNRTGSPVAQSSHSNQLSHPSAPTFSFWFPINCLWLQKQRAGSSGWP